jgi:hypothetical protein
LVSVENDEGTGCGLHQCKFGFKALPQICSFVGLLILLQLNNEKLMLYAPLGPDIDKNVFTLLLGLCLERQEQEPIINWSPFVAEIAFELWIHLLQHPRHCHHCCQRPLH